VEKSLMGEHYLSELHQRILMTLIRQLVVLIHSGPLTIPSFSSDENRSHLLVTTDHNYIRTTVDYDRAMKDEPFGYAPLIIPANTIQSSISSATINDISSQLQQYYEQLTVVTRGIPSLSDDTIRLSSESLRHQHLAQSCQNQTNQIKESFAETETDINVIKLNREILQQEISSMKQKIDDSQSLAYDGTLTWKTSNVSDKMADAQSERQTSIYSPPFYSSPTGYKMRARLYLQGDGNARRTHMSLFFVIMRGKYDAILKWPFSFKVTFCLYDQSGQQQHIVDSFRPDIKSNSFQRPRSEMNIASGIPKFFPLPMIEQVDNNYIKDDTMYIKVIVDFGDISKIILPYILNLNPGLPTYVQRQMIKQEIEKRQAQQPLSFPVDTSMPVQGVNRLIPPSNDNDNSGDNNMTA
ncbi:unnamed protein product, partial [Didymodactylos carnosus]